MGKFTDLKCIRGLADLNIFCFFCSAAENSSETEVEEENDYDYNNDVGPLEPWGNACKAKLAIVAELKKDASIIHNFIPSGEY